MDMKNSQKENPTTAIVEQQTNTDSLTHPEKDFNIDAFLEKRKEFILKVNTIMVEGKDYHVIQGKKSLAKGGAEKIASIFGWSASFRKDEDVLSAFKIDGLIAFVCELSKAGVSVGQGRGAATLEKNGKDPNKTVKMAQKSAFIDAVLRASGLSDFFTQDLEDMNLTAAGQTQSKILPSDNKITAKQVTEYLCAEHGPTVILVPGGNSKKTGKPYKAFYSCSAKVDGGFCKAGIVDSDHNPVRQNPETGDMELIPSYYDAEKGYEVPVGRI